MGSGVKKNVEKAERARSGAAAGLELRLLGPLTIRRQDVELALPSSRKARALLAYLSLSPHPVARTQL